MSLPMQKSNFITRKDKSVNSKTKGTGKKASTGTDDAETDLNKKHSNTHRKGKTPFQVMLPKERNELLCWIKETRNIGRNSDLLFTLLDEEKKRLLRRKKTPESTKKEGAESATK